MSVWHKCGSIGIAQRHQCPTSCFVISAGGNGLDEVNHDCTSCRNLIELYGTCEYMHQAKPERCKCVRLLTNKPAQNRQAVIESASTTRTRLAYWRNWMVTEGIQQGLTVEPTKPAPNLLKTGGESANEEEE